MTSNWGVSDVRGARRHIITIDLNKIDDFAQIQAKKNCSDKNSYLSTVSLYIF